MLSEWSSVRGNIRKCAYTCCVPWHAEQVVIMRSLSWNAGRDGGSSLTHSSVAQFMSRQDEDGLKPQPLYVQSSPMYRIHICPLVPWARMIEHMCASHDASPHLSHSFPAASRGWKRVKPQTSGAPQPITTVYLASHGCLTEQEHTASHTALQGKPRLSWFFSFSTPFKLHRLQPLSSFFLFTFFFRHPFFLLEKNFNEWRRVTIHHHLLPHPSLWSALYSVFPIALFFIFNPTSVLFFLTQLHFFFPPHHISTNVPWWIGSLTDARRGALAVSVCMRAPRCIFGV